MFWLKTVGSHGLQAKKPLGIQEASTAPAEPSFLAPFTGFRLGPGAFHAWKTQRPTKEAILSSALSSNLRYRTVLNVSELCNLCHTDPAQSQYRS